MRSRVAGTVVVCVFAATAWAGSVDQWGLMYECGDCGCTAGAMGTLPNTTDGYDAGHDFPVGVGGFDGYAGAYHEQYVDGWEGPTGFYNWDFRAPIGPGESTTWEHIYAWADPSWPDELIPFTIAADPYNRPPADWYGVLELIDTPKDIDWPAGEPTEWTVSMTEPFVIMIPTFTTENPLESYEFRFTIHATPEPASFLLMGLPLLLRRRS